jgi:hypothetical protein
MATKRPSFLKRQKEQKRNAKALEKREARKARKESRATEQDISMAPDPLVEETAEDHDKDHLQRPQA